jgi:type II secretory pathway pseudopilin PulG
VEVALPDGSPQPEPLAGATPSDSSRTRRLRTVVAVIGLAAVLAGAILSYLLGAANKANDANRRTIADQQATIDQLRAENRTLQGLAAKPRGQAEPSPPTGRQLRSGTLLLPYLNCVDLDTPAGEYWRLTDAGCGRSADVLLGQDYQGLRAAVGTLDPVPGGQGSFAGCSGGGMAGTAILYHQLKPKTQICARTSANNVALLEVVTIDVGPAHPDLITFSVTVWAPEPVGTPTAGPGPGVTPSNPSR